MSKSQKVNEDKDLVKARDLQAGKDVLKSLLDTMNLPKVTLIGVLHQAGYSAQDCALIVGTGHAYARACIVKYRNDPNTAERVAKTIVEMPSWFRMTRQALLPNLAAAQGRAVDEYMKDPLLLIDKPALAKQIAVQAGIKMDEAQHPTLQINFALVQQGQVADLNAQFPRLADRELEVVDVEAVEVDEK